MSHEQEECLRMRSDVEINAYLAFPNRFEASWKIRVLWVWFMGSAAEHKRPSVSFQLWCMDPVHGKWRSCIIVDCRGLVHRTFAQTCVAKRKESRISPWVRDSDRFLVSVVTVTNHVSWYFVSDQVHQQNCFGAGTFWNLLWGPCRLNILIKLCPPSERVAQFLNKQQ